MEPGSGLGSAPGLFKNCNIYFLGQAGPTLWRHLCMRFSVTSMFETDPDPDSDVDLSQKLSCLIVLFFCMYYYYYYYYHGSFGAQWTELWSVKLLLSNVCWSELKEPLRWDGKCPQESPSSSWLEVHCGWFNLPLVWSSPCGEIDVRKKLIKGSVWKHDEQWHQTCTNS